MKFLNILKLALMMILFIPVVILIIFTRVLHFMDMHYYVLIFRVLLLLYSIFYTITLIRVLKE